MNPTKDEIYSFLVIEDRRVFIGRIAKYFNVENEDILHLLEELKDDGAVKKTYAKSNGWDERGNLSQRSELNICWATKAVEKRLIKETAIASSKRRADSKRSIAEKAKELAKGADVLTRKPWGGFSKEVLERIDLSHGHKSVPISREEILGE